jgi:hypothetical protein
MQQQQQQQQQQYYEIRTSVATRSFTPDTVCD